MATEKGVRHLNLSRSTDSGIVEIAGSGDMGSRGGSPLSPSSAFGQRTVADVPHSFIDAVLFCHWDNILGPRLEHVWYVSERSQPHVNILRFITSQVLSGEICRELHTSLVDFKFFDIPDKGVVIPSFVFSAQRGVDLALHALALIIPNSELSVFLQVNDVVQSWFTRIIARFRVLLNKRTFGEEDVERFTCWLRCCLRMLSSLHEAALPHTIYLSYTALCPSCNLEQDFLQQAIASHLMTFGRSIVVGRSPERVNKVVHTLALFSWETERACSRQAVDGKHWPYAHDLCIQGILKNKDGSYDLPMRDILYSRYPSSIIDVQKRDIRQSSSLAEHSQLSYVVTVEELNHLYSDRGNMSSFTSMFRSADIPETLVRTLLDELHKLPVQRGIREAFVMHFMHLLQRRAITLVKHVEVETQRGTQPFRGGLKKLRLDLNLSLDGDLRIVLAAAEKLKPGLCQVLLGERKLDAEYLPSMTDF